MSGNNQMQSNQMQSQEPQSFMQLMQDPSVQKYFANLGAGMMNQPTFGQALASGVAKAQGGLAQDQQFDIEIDRRMKAKRAEMQRIQDALKAYGISPEELQAVMGTLGVEEQQSMGLLD